MWSEQQSAVQVGVTDTATLLYDASQLLTTDPGLALTYCAQALDALNSGPQDASLRAQAEVQSADAALKLGDMNRALNHITTALALPPAQNLLARAHRIRAHALLSSGDMDAAYDSVGQAIRYADGQGQIDVLADALNLKAQIQHRRGESTLALGTLEHAQSLRGALGDVAGEIRSACNRALILIALTRQNDALNILQWALERTVDSESPVASGLHVHSNMGMILEGMERYEEASTHFLLARQAALASGDRSAHAILSLNAGEIARKTGRADAFALLDAARTEALELNLASVKSAALHSLGLLHCAHGDLQAAEACLSRAEAIADSIGDLDKQLDAMLGRAKNWLAMDGWVLARPKLEETLALATEHGRSQVAFDAHMLLAGGHEAEDPRASLRHLRHATQLEREQRDVALAAQAQQLANDTLLSSARLEAEHERQLRTVSDHARLEAESQVQAQLQELERGRLHDGVTGLPNRLLLRALMGQEIREETPFSLLVVDFDRFRGMLDVLGLIDGDELLRQAAQRLESLVAAGDTLSRLSSDVFALLVRGDHDLATIQRRASQLLAAFFAEFQIGTAEVVIGATVGVARFPAHGNDPDDLLRAASQAASDAKNGAGVIVAAAPVVGEAGRSVTLSLESGLARALERNEFELHFQPLVDAVSVRPVSGEALLRWNSAALGRRSPAEFIPLLERSGLIVPVGDWVLQEACRQAAGWGDVRVAVNLSARQFMGGDLVDTVRRALRSSGLEPERLELEITESLMMQSPERAVRLLTELKRTGVRVMLDDFGTGFSNLSYLHAFPLDGLKIDRSFVVALEHGERAGGIIEAIVQMGDRLGLEVVAEGIETQEQHLTLQKLGVPILQGYLFGRPTLNWTPGQA